jgi:hypothetical protein
MGFQALRMVLTFAYLEAPAVKVAMGVTPPEPPEGDLETELHHLARTARAVAAEIR